MLRDSLDCLVNLDSALANAVCVRDNEVDALKRAIRLKAEEMIRKNPERAPTLLTLVAVSRNLERIADHASNIAEDVIYMVEGRIVRHTDGVPAGCVRCSDGTLVRAIAVRVLAPNAPPEDLQGGNVDGHHEQLPQMIRRRLQRAHAVPGVRRSLEEQAAVSPRVDRGADAEVVEGRARMGLPSPLVIQDQHFASPTRIPVLLGIEVEDVRGQLAPGVAVRRNGTTLPGKVPLHGQD
jgi:hypothetical protein